MAKQKISDLLKKHSALTGEVRQQINDALGEKPPPADLVLKAKVKRLGEARQRLDFLNQEMEQARKEVTRLEAEIVEDRDKVETLKKVGKKVGKKIVKKKVKKKVVKKATKKITKKKVIKKKTKKKVGKKTG